MKAFVVDALSIALLGGSTALFAAALDGHRVAQIVRASVWPGGVTPFARASARAYATRWLARMHALD